MGAVLQGFDCDVLMTANPSVAATTETATDSGNHLLYTLSVHKYWDKSKALLVECSPNGTSGWVAVTDYKIQWVGGLLSFNTVRVVGTNNYVRVTGYYWIASQLTDSHTWELDQSVGTVEVTTFQSQWKTYISTVKNASAKVGTYKYDDSLTKDLGNLMILVLYLDKSVGTRYECYGYITKVTPKSDAGSVITEEVDFTIDGDVFYLAS